MHGCGKVTQTSTKSADVTTFDLKYSVAIVATSDPVYKIASTNYFTPSDSSVYTIVYGINDSGKAQELSWGKAILTFKAGVSPSASPVAKVTSLRKGDIELDSADYTWAKLGYDQSSKTWSADIKKVKQGFPLYLVAFYTPRGKAYLSLIPAKRVSGNAVTNLGQLSPYETFISTLCLMDLHDQKGVVTETVAPGALKTFYSEEFFDMASYTMTRTSSSKFEPENPSFVFSGNLEQKLLDVYSLVKEKELGEAKLLVEKYTLDSPKWLPEKPRAWLMDKLKEQTKATPSNKN
ncbi:hypothetical protein EB093_03435 [bacterium]|nr:hypothetical protein [bacterium]